MTAFRARLRRAAPPREILALLGCTALLVAAWSWVNPVFAGAPDENAHVGWVQHYAENLGGSGTRPGYASTEQAEGIVASHSDFVTGNPTLTPPRDQWRYDDWLTRDYSATERGDAAGPNPAAANPPLYYAVAALPYLAGSSADLFTRALLVRLLGLFLGALLAFVVWHLAKELLPDGPGRLIATAVAGLMPMIGFVEGAVNPDAAMYPAWAFVMLAAVKSLRTGERRWILALLVGTGVAVAIKYQSLTLLPGVGLVLVVIAYSRLPERISRRASVLALGGVTCLAAVGLVLAGQRGWLGAQVEEIFSAQNDRTLPQRVREYVSYVWQFYLPRPSFLTLFPIPDTVNFWDTVFTQYVGAFGWHEIKLATWIYIVALVVSVAGLLGVVRAMVVHRAFRRNGPVLAFFAMVAISLFLSVHWTEYTMLKNGEQAFVQGRYFLPLNPLFALAIGAAVGPALARWPRAQLAAAGGLVGGLVLLNFASFGAVLQRFYG